MSDELRNKALVILFNPTGKYYTEEEWIIPTQVVRACWGPLRLWDHYLPEAADISSPQEFLSTDFDGRYGGECEARWDGQNYWVAQEPETIQRDLETLSPVLESFPQVPEGFSGWWSFR
ncbi:MAG: hypothetical protein IJI97_06755 [Clostridia bacterium]|nr:hypothetical protein [Clostridia bacterium]